MKVKRARHQIGGASVSPWVFVILGVAFIGLGATVLKDASPNVLDGIELNFGKTVANVGVFLIFIQVINSFFYKPLADAVNQRNSELESTFSKAEQLKSEMQKMKSDYEVQLAEAEASAREQIQASVKEAQVLRLQLMTEASEKAEQLLRQAQEEIAVHRERMISELRLRVIDLTLSATEKVIAKNVDNEVNRKLVQELVNTLEATN